MTKNTSFNLGEHFEVFVKQQVKTGRYSSGSDVMRAALRTLEAQENHLEILRQKLAIGADQADRGEFVDNFSMDEIQKRLDTQSS